MGDPLSHDEKPPQAVAARFPGEHRHGDNECFRINAFA